MANLIQRSFTGGELSPSLFARVDQQKYASGLRLCRNFMVQRHGGVANRPGLRFIAEASVPTGPMRLVPFIYSANQVTQNHVLVFTDLKLRLIHDSGEVVMTGVSAYNGGTAYTPGDLVTNGGFTYYCIKNTTGNAPPNAIYWYLQPQPIYEIPSPYAAADLALVKYVQSADVMTFVHPNYPIYELKRYGPLRWTLAPMPIGPGIGTPTGLALAGGNAGVRTYYQVTAIDALTGEESLAATVSDINRIPSLAVPTVISWAGVAGASDYKVYRSTDGVTYGYIGNFGGSTTTKSIAVWTDNNATVSTVALGYTTSADSAEVNAVTIAADKPADQTFTINGRWRMGVTDMTRMHVSGYLDVYYSRDGEPQQFATTLNMDPASDNVFRAFSQSFTVPDNGYASVILYFVPRILATYNVYPPVGGDTWTGEVDVSAAPDNNVSWAGVGAASFTDTLLAVDLLSRPPTQASLFNGSTRYPSAVGRYQQRLLLAATDEMPEMTWASRTGIGQSFTRSFPIAGDDSLSWSSAGRQVNEVRHLLDLGRLIVFTSGGEIMIEGNQDGVLLPDAINPKQLSYSGSSQLAPIIVVNTALFVQARGTVVRDIMNDAVEGSKGNDLTLFASHLFDSFGLVDWAYQQIPHSVVWVIRNDGRMLGLTYIREQGIWGWHQHVTDGTFENICVIPEDNEDAVYVVVNRLIQGVTRRFIERMTTRAIGDIRDACFVDSALSYDGTNTSATTMTLSGGALWDAYEELTITASAGTFTALMVGNEVVFTNAAGNPIRFRLENFTSATVMTGHAIDEIPVELQNVATAVWGMAADELANLDHLEGKFVSVLGDGEVVASPVDDSAPTLEVIAGKITLPQPRVKITAGLPYYADLQTLDIESLSGSTVKDRRMLVNQLTVFIQDSRGFMAGAVEPPDGIVSNLYEYKSRVEDDDYGLPALITDGLDVQIDGSWNNNGRVFIRQPYPLPLTVLSIAPSGYLTTSHSSRG